MRLRKLQCGSACGRILLFLVDEVPGPDIEIVFSSGTGESFDDTIASIEKHVHKCITKTFELASEATDIVKKGSIRSEVDCAEEKYDHGNNGSDKTVSLNRFIETDLVRQTRIIVKVTKNSRGCHQSKRYSLQPGAKRPALPGHKPQWQAQQHVTVPVVENVEREVVLEEVCLAERNLSKFEVIAALEN